MQRETNAGAKLEATIQAAGEAPFSDLFESVPISLWVADWSEVFRLLDEVRDGVAGDWAGWLQAHSAFVDLAVRSVMVTNVNTATL